MTRAVWLPQWTAPSSFIPDEQELSVAQWVYEHRQPAGLGTDTLPGAKALYLPLISSGGAVGVVGILPETERTMLRSRAIPLSRGICQPDRNGDRALFFG